MATSASSSQVPQEEYDVFISFRGLDVRNGFLSHLKKELRQKQIDFYVDERLERGDEISSTLMEAIEGSMISLVIFSKDYASSKWCLEELVKIMECKEANGQIVIPIFHNVDPSDVRHQKGSYADAFAQHEQKFKVNIGKLQIWRSTLTRVANLSGYHYSSNFQDESELIDGIVKDVWKNLEGRDIVERKCLVGFEQNFACVKSLMKIESQEVRLIGIWGTGGIGKTTLAHAIVDEFSSYFQSSCFMENVREESKKSNGLSNLRQKLLCDLLNQQNLNMNDALIARSIKRRLLRRKMLVVLDDVDTSKQLKDLVGEQILGSGSRVIVTSRDKHVLISGGIQDEHIHEVHELNFAESLELFSLNAFKQSHPKEEYEKLSYMTVEYAKGIPLALEVLGSHFYAKDKIYWESELNKLKNCPNGEVQNVLKVSYDGLDHIDKEIFLDIAFFFVGQQKHEVISVLDGCYHTAVSGIENLVNKALIKIVGSVFIQMHDLIREMAEQIVREESIKHPERRSRLNNSREVCDLLKNNMGTDEIVGLILDMTQTNDLQLCCDTFTKMKKLRILKFYFTYSMWHMRSNIKLPYGLESFSNELRYLCWDEYPLESLPLSFCPENLVELHIEYSKVKKLWDGIQDIVNLKTLNLRESVQLMELPDLSMAHKLEKINLAFCTSLRNVHPSILSLHSLVELAVSCCRKLRSLQSETHLESLSILKGGYCRSLKKFSLSLEKMTEIDLRRSKIEILHLPIGRLIELKVLCLNGERLKSLPINELYSLTNLKEFELRGFRYAIDKMELEYLFDALRYLCYLDLEGCRKISEIPENIKALTSIKNLSLEGTSVESLPAIIEHLSSLTYINLKYCWKLRSILGLPPLLEYLDAKECTSLETVIPSALAPVEQKILNECCFKFYNCVKLDEPSLSFIREFTHFSLLSASKYGGYRSRSACYPGSRVPIWIPYKQTAGASSNTVEFTCNLHRLCGFIFCCVLPQFTLDTYYDICCDSIDGDKHKLFSLYPKFGVDYLNSDHVFLWYDGYISYLDYAQSSDHGKFAFQFYLCGSPNVLYDNDKESYQCDLIKACGVCPIYNLKLDSEFELKSESELLSDSNSESESASTMELERKRKRDVEIDDKEQFPSTKKLKKSSLNLLYEATLKLLSWT